MDSGAGTECQHNRAIPRISPHPALPLLVSTRPSGAFSRGFLMLETGFGIEPNGRPCTGGPTGLKPAAGASQLNQSTLLSGFPDSSTVCIDLIYLTY